MRWRALMWGLVRRIARWRVTRRRYNPTVADSHGASTPPPDASRGARLDSWKEIAAYLNRDLRTLQRWEKTAQLPIRRLNKPGMRAVFAYTSDLDEWLRAQSPQPAAAPPDDRVSAAASDSFASSDRRRTRIRRRAALAAAAATAVAVAAFVALRSPVPLAVVASRPITADVGSERDPAISPDGKTIAYVAATPTEPPRIQVRLIDGGEPHPLTTTPGSEWSPAWSPDGARLAFLRGDPTGTATVVTISRLGDDERAVGDVRPYPWRRADVIGHLLAWGRDGRHVVVPDRQQSDTSALVLIDTQTGARRALTMPAPGEVDVEPTLSADGRLLLFTRVRREFESVVCVQPLAADYTPDGALRHLPSAQAWNGTPRLLERRGEVLTSAGSLPRLSLWRQPLDGSAPPVSLGIIGDHAVQAAVHEASGRIVSRTYREQSDVLRLAIPETPSQLPVVPPVEGFLESTFVDRGPAYSADGSRVAFISDRTGRRQLWVAGAAGERPTEWTQEFELMPPTPSWSPDGSRVVCVAFGPSRHSQLFVVDAATRLATAVTHDDRDYGHATWAPDGRALYAAAIDTGRFGIYRVPVDGGAAELVLPDYRVPRGTDPAGRGLYVTRANPSGQHDLVYVALPAGPPVHLAAMIFAEDAWVTPAGVYYMARREGRPLALFFRTHAGVVTLIQEYTRPAGVGLSVSADGRHALTTRLAPPISDLLLLETAK